MRYLYVAFFLLLASFAAAQKPTITSFTPASGIVGSSVTITGTNYSTTLANNTVFFGAVKATVTAASATQLTVTVPVGATYKPISVMVNGLAAYSSKPFLVDFPSDETLSLTDFEAKVDFTAAASVRSVAIGDFDGDGKTDVAVGTNTSIYIFRNTSTMGETLTAASFASPVILTGGSNTSVGLETADLDMDGKLDLAIVNNSTSIVSVIRNTSTSGSISFDAKVDFSLGTSTASGGVSIGDLDNDGKPDMVVCNNATSNISIFRNISTVGSLTTSSFATKVDITTLANPFRTAMEDLDGDGKSDLIVGYSSLATVSTFRNISTSGSITTGSFSAKVDFTTVGFSLDIAAGDLDNDGKPDLAVASTSGLSILRSLSTSGTISFAPKVDFATSIGQIVKLTDLDSDGKLDVIMPYSSTLQVLENNSSSGTISLQPELTFTVTSPTGSAIGDMDGDDRPDIITGSGSSISVFRSESPTVASMSAYSGVSGSQVTINGDNWSNLLTDYEVKFNGVTATKNGLPTSSSVTVTVPSGASSGLVTVKVGKAIGTSSFNFRLLDTKHTVTSFTPTSGAIGSSVTITGTKFSTTPANNIVYFGGVKATVTAATATQLTVTVPAGAMYAPLSVTLDGLTVYSTKSYAVTFSSSGNIDANTFGAKVDVSANSSPNYVKMRGADFDGDGKIDLIHNTSTNNYIYRNTSSANSITLATGTGFTSGGYGFPSLADIDSDGKLDYVSGGTTFNTLISTSSPGSINTGSFSSTISATSLNNANPEVIDLDGDGRQDVVFVGGTVMSVYQNVAGTNGFDVNSFSPKIDFTVLNSLAPANIACGDIDGDGKPEIAAVNTSNTVSIFRNLCTPGTINSSSLAAKVDFATGVVPFDVQLADMDGDGKLDMLVTNSTGNTLSIYRNTATSGSITASSFSGPTDFTTGTTPKYMTIADINGDSKPDVAVANYASSTVSIFKNTSTTGNISFAAKVDLNSTTQNYAVVACDLDGDGLIDIATKSILNTSPFPIGTFRNLTVIAPTPTITNFNPTSGIVGNQVIITGTNFSATPANNIVKFNGTTANVTASTTTSITTTVPSGATSGNITVEVSGVVGTSSTSFTVTPPPTISSFNPTSGIVGASVTISGTNFSTTPGNNTVKFNGTAASVTASTATSITTSVPSGATSGTITVEVGGQTATSSTTFSVIPPPTVSSFNPTSGVVGTTITITGTNFSATPANNTVKFNNTTAAVTASTATSITVTVPTGATTGTISVTVSGQTGTSSGSFTVAPSITSFDPTSGTIGTVVTITGLNFNATAASNTVKFNGTTATVTASTTTSITATVPSGATTGTITVTVGSQTATSSGTFTVIPPPTITNFDPLSGIIGAAVTITGTNFSTTPASNVVKFNGTTATVTASTTTTLTTTVPTGATSGTISVTVGSQTTTSTGSFTVIPPPSVTGFNPQSGIVGTPVTITGANFSATTANNTVKFGGVAATIQSNTTTSIVALVPATGLTGPITVEVSSIGMGSSSNNFTVGPIVTGFNPTTGIVGDVITITGLNFSSTDANNVVKFNNTTAVATASTTTSITTAIPAGATTGPLSVTIGSLTGSGNTDFTVIPAPIISSFNPGSGEVGDQVIINGNNFSTTSTNNVVKFNGTTANVSASTATTITTSVPTGATTGKITVTVNNQTTTSDSDFSIIVVSNLVQITNETFITKFAKGATDLKVSITVNDASKVSVMNFKSRGISEAASALKTTVVTASANKFEKIFAAAELSDAIGLVYYFEGTDTNGNTIISNTGKGFIEYPTTSTDHTIPSLKFGETVADYQIISVPLVLEDKKVTTVLASLGTYDNTQWRLFDYNTTNGDNREYPGFTNIEIGKGYWLIARNQVVINPGAGSAPQVDDATPFVMNLAAGWNLVGNPYNFRISWTDVLAANPTITGVGNLKVFNSGTLGESNVIDRYRGAFVFSNTATALKIPVLRNTTLGGGRVGSSEIDLDADQWTLPLEITNGKLSNQTGGIGMNPYATLLSKDDFDEVAVPLPAGLTLFEIQFHHPEVAANFTKEIVPTTENYSWEFSIKNESAEELTIKWPADLFVESNREIYLYETTTKTVINMKEKFSAMITPAMRSIRIISGSKNYIEKELDDLLPFVSTAYPNPAKDIVNFPIRVAAKQGESMVRVQVINGLSQQTEIYNTSLKPGNHNIQWKPTETGLHFIKVSVGSQSTYLKVIVQ